MTRPAPATGSPSAHVTAIRNELGGAGGAGPIGTPRVPEQINMLGTTDPYELTRELQWPLNFIVYEKMRRSDTQIGGAIRGIKMPPLGVDWQVERGTRIRQEVADTVEAELGLWRDHQGRRRPLPGGVSWDETQRHALMMLEFGNAYFETWWQPGTSTIEGLAGAPANHFRLSPRLARAIAKFDVGPDGELRAIWQNVSDGTAMFQQRAIPRADLVPFVNDREGADWSGKSILRSSYKNWLLKDNLIRTGALAADRQGMGVPVITYPAATETGGTNDANERKALEIASAIRAGEESGVALPVGWTLALVGVEGSIIDVMPQVRYHDQAIAMGALAMFMNLGHDAGARSLGDTFFDVFMMSEQMLIRYLEEVYTEECSRRIVEANFGAAEPYPAVTAGEPNAEVTALALNQLADAGLLGDLSDGVIPYVRARFGLPAPTVVDLAPPVPAPTPPGQLPTAPTPPAARVPGLVPPAPRNPTRTVPTAPLPVAAAAGHDPAAGETLIGRLQRATAILQGLEQPTPVG